MHLYQWSSGFELLARIAKSWSLYIVVPLSPSSCPQTLLHWCGMGGMFTTRKLQYYTDWKHQAVRVSCSECTFTVYCGCSDNILYWITGDLNMYSVRKYMQVYCLLLVTSNETPAFRMASSNRSLIAKYCACACIEFLTGIFSWSVDCKCRCMLVCLELSRLQLAS
jgi:hypothetical protein